METQRKELQRENSTGNNLQSHIWTQSDSEEEEIASENALLDENDEPRFVCERAYQNYLLIKDYAFVDYHEY